MRDSRKMDATFEDRLDPDPPAPAHQADAEADEQRHPGADHGLGQHVLAQA